MKKTFMLMCIALLVMTSIAAISATPVYKTVVAGKIYDSPNFETANGVAGANIDVTCNGNLLETTSLSDGTYSVSYADSASCPDDSTVTVEAEKNGVSNSGTGKVHDYTAPIGVYLGVVNVSLIPEFGLAIGALTLVSAVAIFFVVRRK